MKGIILIYTILLVLVLWLANNECEFLKATGSNSSRDYALQPWIYGDSDKNWHRAHNFMYETLANTHTSLLISVTRLNLNILLYQADLLNLPVRILLPKA